MTWQYCPKSSESSKKTKCLIYPRSTEQLLSKCSYYGSYEQPECFDAAMCLFHRRRDACSRVNKYLVGPKWVKPVPPENVQFRY